MGIYRGAGGTGDALTDASSQLSYVVSLTAQATTAATNAATSATNAATSETNAAASAVTAASFTPSQTGNAGKYLTTNGTSTSWGTITGGVTSVTGTAPISSSGGSTPAISISQATTSTNGYLTSTDWNTFNGKGNGTVTSVAATVPSFLSITGSPVTSSGTLAISYSGTALPVANGGTGVTTSTGSGNNVLSTSPTLVTPVLGTPSSGTLTNCTSIPVNQATGILPVANGGTGISTASSLVRAWANWDGTAASLITPRSSFNVSSITKSAAGTYYVNFTTAMANANYAVVCSVGPSLATGNVQPFAIPIGTGGSSTTQCGIIITQGSGYTIGDLNYVNIAIFGN